LPGRATRVLIGVDQQADRQGRNSETNGSTELRSAAN